MVKTYGVMILSVSICLFTVGCGKTDTAQVETNAGTPETQNPDKKTKAKHINRLPVNVVKLVNKNSTELEDILGKPLEVKKTEDGGEYHLYEIENEPKGLAIRLYDDKARSFNVLLERKIKTSREALRSVFGLDVGSKTSIKDPKEPLSENYQGTFSGIKFSKISAKKDAQGKGFIFVLVEAGS